MPAASPARPVRLSARGEEIERIVRHFATADSRAGAKRRGGAISPSRRVGCLGPGARQGGSPGRLSRLSGSAGPGIAGQERQRRRPRSRESRRRIAIRLPGQALQQPTPPRPFPPPPPRNRLHRHAHNWPRPWAGRVPTPVPVDNGGSERLQAWIAYDGLKRGAAVLDACRRWRTRNLQSLGQSVDHFGRTGRASGGGASRPACRRSPCRRAPAQPGCAIDQRDVCRGETRQARILVGRAEAKQSMLERDDAMILVGPARPRRGRSQRGSRSRRPPAGRRPP